jgi:4-amino-4-deoxy-L-arabinose transferase-like glycosyltransferase
VSGKIGRLPVFLLLAAWAALGLFGHDPWKPDEAYSFGLVYHILESGDWLVPTLAGEPFVEKPPLFFWTAAVFARLFGWALPLHDAARLACAFYVGLTLWFTCRIARTIRGQVPISAVLILAGSLGYLQHAHQLVTDNALMAGLAMGLYGLARQNGPWLGTGAGIAFLSKGLLGPGFLALTALFVVPLKEYRHSWRSWPWALAAFAPWALIWPWLLYRHSPVLFHEWFWVNNFGRFTGSAGLGGVLDHALYVKALVWFALPAWPLAAYAVWKERFSPGIQLPLVAFVVMLVVLSAASSARSIYGLPMLVPLALLAAHGLESLPAWIGKPLDALAVEGSAALALLLWLAWIAFVVGWHPGFLEAQSPGFVPRVQALGLVAALLVTGLCLWSMRRGTLALHWLAGVTLVWGPAMTLWLPWLDHAKSYAAVIGNMQRHLAGCVSTKGLTEPQRAMFHYFAGIKASSADCPMLLIHTGTPQAPQPGDGWRLVWSGTRPGDTKEYFWLFRRGGG